VVVGWVLSRRPALQIDDPVAGKELDVLDSPHGRFLAEELADLGIHPTIRPSALREAFRAEIAARTGEQVEWEPDEAGWRVRCHGQTFRARSPEAALAWCLLYLRAPEYGASDDLDG